MTMIAIIPKFLYLLLLPSNGQEYAKIFQFMIKMDCTCAKKRFFKFEL